MRPPLYVVAALVIVLAAVPAACGNATHESGFDVFKTPLVK